MKLNINIFFYFTFFVCNLKTKITNLVKTQKRCAIKFFTRIIKIEKIRMMSKISLADKIYREIHVYPV